MKRFHEYLSAGGLWLLGLFLLGPLLWAVVASFANEAALFGETSNLSFGLDHYRVVLSERAFWRPLLNSLLVSGTTTLLCVSLASLAAYALTRLRFRGRSLLSGLFLVVAMFPQVSIVAPLYVLLRKLSLIDSTPGLVLPYLTFAMPLAVWLLVSHMRQLPAGVEEAAQLDGASRFVVLKDIVVPMALPGIVSTAIVTFIYCWNEFLFALSFTIGSDQRTAPVAIALFRGQYQVPWGQVLAGTVLATLPVALLVLFFQKRITRSLVT
jgi:ABC-type glycerol-3-phosphate transport system permease component